MGPRSFAMVVAVDLLLAIFLNQSAVIQLMTIKQRQTPPQIKTYGKYAVTIQWPGSSMDDVDLYVQDPAGNVAFFANPSAGLMHLEHDDLGLGSNTTTYDGKTYSVKFNTERTVLRGILPGEYTVNVQMYSKLDSGPTRVTVRLWDLQGADRLLAIRTVTLSYVGDERTAFRFTLDAQGRECCLNELQKSLVRTAP